MPRQAQQLPNQQLTYLGLADEARVWFDGGRAAMGVWGAGGCSWWIVCERTRITPEVGCPSNVMTRCTLDLRSTTATGGPTNPRSPSPSTHAGTYKHWMHVSRLRPSGLESRSPRRRDASLLLVPPSSLLPLSSKEATDTRLPRVCMAGGRAGRPLSVHVRTVVGISTGKVGGWTLVGYVLSVA